MIQCDWCIDYCKEKKSFKCKGCYAWICKGCIQKNMFEHYKWPKCCSKEIKHTELVKIFSTKTLNKMILEYDKRYIVRQGGIKYCPKAKCGKAFMIDDGCQIYKLTCPKKKCGCKWCNICQKKWKKGHRKKCDGITKIERQINKIDNKDKSKKKKKSKGCPSCGTLITKRSGCNEMSCSWCGFDFCWKCQCSYDSCSCNELW